MTEHQQEFYKVISFSLPEADELKIRAAIENAKLVSTVFPGWRAHFLVSESLDQETKDAISAEENCFVYEVKEDTQAAKEAWTFLPLGQPESVSAVISRESDTVLTQRDYAAVEAWMDSPVQFHTIRDCEEDRGLPINAKFFGAKLHGPINTVWLLHFLHNVNKDGVVVISDLLNRFYGGFHFLFMEHDDEKRFNGVPFPENASKDDGYVGIKFVFKEEE